MASSSTFYESSDPPSSPPSFRFSASQHSSSPKKATERKETHAHDVVSRKICSNKFFTLTLLAAIIIALTLTFWDQFSTHTISGITHHDNLHPQHPVSVTQPASSTTSKKRKYTPEEWLRKRTTTDYDAPVKTSSKRPKAALISLVRNEELDGILQSMRQLEYTWNRRYRYPWIFFSEGGFSEEFKAATSNATSASTEYHHIPREHWSTPSWINTTIHHDSLTYLPHLSVGKSHLLSYRHMCRWNSGFFYLHPALAEYDYYWRVEPDVHFFCEIGYDVFAFMQANGLMYGFNMAILEDARSFTGLWGTTVSFAEANPHYLHPEANWRWLLDGPSNPFSNDGEEGEATGGYNNCQFFSNFEIGSLKFFRSKAYQAYFKHLDEMGGFYYERFGDAPTHTLAVSLFAARDEVWFFRDVGYQHDAARHCPPPVDGEGGRCMCEQTRLDENFYKLVPMESPQKKPMDTCIRRWLGGEWLRKREGWKREVEVKVGGDGYGGYVKD